MHFYVERFANFIGRSPDSASLPSPRRRTAKAETPPQPSATRHRATTFGRALAVRIHPCLLEIKMLKNWLE